MIPCHLISLHSLGWPNGANSIVGGIQKVWKCIWSIKESLKRVRHPCLESIFQLFLSFGWMWIGFENSLKKICLSFYSPSSPSKICIVFHFVMNMCTRQRWWNEWLSNIFEFFFFTPPIILSSISRVVLFLKKNIVMHDWHVNLNLDLNTRIINK